MAKLVVMTDLHMLPEGETIIGLDPHARLSAALEHAMARHADADALILTGDLTHRGDVASYRRLRALLDAAPVPVLPLLGNHDRRAGFAEVFPDAPVTASGHVQRLLDLTGWRAICLDTLDEGSHAGRLCPARLAWLDTALAGAAGRQVVVFAHHPPVAVGLPGMDRIALDDGPALLDRLAAAGAHLVFGHVHRTANGSSRGVPWTMFKSPCHQAPLDLVTPDSSLSIDEPGAYGVLLLGRDGLVAHSEDVLPEAKVGQDPASH